MLNAITSIFSPKNQGTPKREEEPKSTEKKKHEKEQRKETDISQEQSHPRTRSQEHNDDEKSAQKKNPVSSPENDENKNQNRYDTLKTRRPPGKTCRCMFLFVILNLIFFLRLF
jgi:FtsZ-interacting cell division protein ZipA